MKKTVEEKLASAKKQIARLKRKIERLEDENFDLHYEYMDALSDLRDFRVMANAANEKLAQLTASAPCLLVHTTNGLQPMPQTEQ